MVQFTQYMRPNGVKKPIEILLTSDVEAKAEALVKAGLTLEAEVLRTGECSFTITSDEGDEAIEVCPNGPIVVEKVRQLIMGFNLDAYQAHRRKEKESESQEGQAEDSDMS